MNEVKLYSEMDTWELLMYSPPFVTSYPHRPELVGSLDFYTDCVFGEGVRFDCSGHITLGYHCMILRRVRIHTHKHRMFYGYCEDVTKETEIWSTNLAIGDNVLIGEDTTIMPNVGRIGDSAIIGAYSVLTKPVEDNEIWAGNPARLIGKRPSQEIR